MPGHLHDLATRGAPLEYWFVQVHLPGLAFLVDVIVRRRTGLAEVRASVWVHGRGRVLRVETEDWRAGEDAVSAGGTGLDGRGCRGSVGDASWELDVRPLEGRIAPHVPLLSRADAFDQQLVSRPRALVDGHVTVAGERFEVRSAPGAVTHYWGRRLPDRWHWISARSFTTADGTPAPDVALEAVVLRGRLWGRPPAAHAGYLWLREPGRESLVVSPLNGLVLASGGAGDLRMTARRPGRTVRVHCTAPAEDYVDLGEGIRQTLLATCRLPDLGLSCTAAGLEHRIAADR